MLGGRLSIGQAIAAVGGIVLLVATFLPWVGVGGPSLPPGVQIPEGISAGGSSDNLWQGSSLDIYLAITGVVALLPALFSLTDSAEEFSFFGAATFLLGVVGTVLVIAFLTVDFPDGADRKVGAFVGLAAVIAIAIGGFRSMQEEVGGEI